MPPEANDHCLGAITRSNTVQISDQPLPAMIQQCKDGYQSDSWFQKHAAQLQHDNGLFYHDGCLFIPDCAGLRRKVYASLHESPYSGHKGRNATVRLVKREYWWPNMDSDIADWVQVCGSCQRNKGDNQAKPGLLQPLPVPARKWSDISMDFITHLPITRRGHTAIFVVVDRLSKLAHFIPTHDHASAENVARLFLDNVFVHHGMPRHIVSDRDPRFTGAFWSHLCELWGCQRCLSTAYHPQSDGQTERVNRTLEDMLRHWCSPDHDDWDDHLKLAEFATNNAWHESVNESPFMLTFGQHPYTPASMFRLDKDGKLKNPAANQFAAEMQRRVNQAKLCLASAQDRQKSYADQHRRAMELKVGTYVKLSTANLAARAGGTPKLHPKWIGPFQVTQKIGDVAYRLLLPEQMKIHNVFSCVSATPMEA